MSLSTKGAPEAVADLCHLPPDMRERVMAQAAALADRGLRVLGVAKARHLSTQDWPAIQHDFPFEWVGLVGLGGMPIFTSARSACGCGTVPARQHRHHDHGGPSAHRPCHCRTGGDRP